MKRTKSKTLRILGGVVLGLLLLLSGYLYWTWPVYPSFTRELGSVSELRETLSKGKTTSSIVVVDLSDYGASEQMFSVDLNGRTRNAEPICCHIDSQNAWTDGAFRIGVSAGEELWKDASFDGESYRGMDARLFVSDAQSTKRGMELDLRCSTYEYAIAVFFDAAGLSEQEISQREADMQVLVYSIADRIIDAGG